MQNFAVLQILVRSLFSDSVLGAWKNNVQTKVGSLIETTSKRDMLGVAISGQTRADAGMLRQASRNVTEASGMMSIASEGASSLNTMLKEAQDLAIKYQASTDVTEKDQLEIQYNALKGNIDNVIETTTYNGMALMDGDQWSSASNEGRVKSSGSKLSGTVEIYAGKSGFDLAFSNARKSISEPLGLLDIDSDGVVNELSEMVTTTEMMTDFYAQRAASLDFQAKSLERQAGILDEVAKNQIFRPEGNIKDILADLAMRDRGTILNEKG